MCCATFFRMGRLIGLVLFLWMLVSGTMAQAVSVPDDLSVHVSTVTGRINFIKPKNKPAAVAPRAKARAPSPEAILNLYGHLFGVTERAAELVEDAAETDALGHRRSTYLQVFNGVPVFSGILKIHQDGQGNFVAANGNFYPIPNALDTTPGIASSAAEEAAIQAMEGETPIVEHSELVIVDPGWYGDPAIGPHLAYHVVIGDAVDMEVHEGFFVDAHSGRILDRWNMTQPARIRQIHDASFIVGNLPGRLVRTELAVFPPIAAEVDSAFDYTRDTYGYFFRGFGRDSIDGGGRVLLATTRAQVGCPNAFFFDRGFGLGPQTVFCTGLVTDDILGHEFTHGVTRFSANLIYQNQPGQLNESFSDVFGELIDLFNGNAAFAGPPGGPPLWPEPPANPGTDVGNQKRANAGCSLPNGFPDGVRWILGENSTSVPQILRDLWRPPCFGNPDSTGSPLYTCGPGDNGSVHSGSSIPNHAFAILTDGKNFGGQDVTGIGPIKAGAVWYRALTVYLTPASNFQDAFVAFNQAAGDLVGSQPTDPRTGLPGAVFTAADAEQVDKALRAVGMNVPTICSAASRSWIYLVDTTGSAGPANVFYNQVIQILTQLLDSIPGPDQFALARFDDYPCFPHGEAVDVPYQLITPFVAAPQVFGFLPVTGPQRGADAPESQIDAIVTALTGRALVPARAGCGPGVPAGQGAFPAGGVRGPTAVVLFTRPRLFHLPAAGKPHIYGINDVTALVSVISGSGAGISGEEQVLTSMVDVGFNDGTSEPAPGPDQTTFKALAASLVQVGGGATSFQNTTGEELCAAKHACAFLGGDSACLDPGDIDANGDWLADQCGRLFPVCDVNLDGDVDKVDLSLISKARGQVVQAQDPRDANGDGRIDPADVKACIPLCTLANCATQ